MSIKGYCSAINRKFYIPKVKKYDFLSFYKCFFVRATYLTYLTHVIITLGGRNYGGI